MINFRTWLLDRVPLNTIESIIIGQHPKDDGNSNEPHLKAQHGFLNIPLGPLKALDLLNYDIQNDALWASDCNPVYIYTKDSIYFLLLYHSDHNYLSLMSLPLNPCKCIPEFI